MKDLTIPVPNLTEEEIAEVFVRVGEKKTSYDFRIESFPWDIEDELQEEDDELTRSLARITRLKNAIKNYDPDWELIQIYTPSENAQHIQVLYRKRNKA
jgi:hypothetical protein